MILVKCRVGFYFSDVDLFPWFVLHATTCIMKFLRCILLSVFLLLCFFLKCHFFIIFIFIFVGGGLGSQMHSLDPVSYPLIHPAKCIFLLSPKTQWLFRLWGLHCHWCIKNVHEVEMFYTSNQTACIDINVEIIHENSWHMDSNEKNDTHTNIVKRIFIKSLKSIAVNKLKFKCVEINFYTRSSDWSIIIEPPIYLEFCG